MSDDGEMYCGYCGGRAVRDEQRLMWVHATAGDRVRVSPGDMVSGRHNRRFTQVLTVDLVDADEDLQDIRAERCPCGVNHTRAEHGL